MSQQKIKLFDAIRRKWRWVIPALVVISFAWISFNHTSQASAATGINHQINFQGKLVNPNGTNVTDGSYSIVFSIYNVSSGGTALWTETQNVTVTTGLFQVNLGSITALPGSVDFNTDSNYLGIKVGTDAEMTPRVLFTSVPQAFNSEKLGGLDKTGFIQNSTSQQATSNFNISGAGVIGTTLTTPMLQAAAGTALTITGNAASTWSTSAGNLTLQAGSGTVSLGTSSNLTSTSALTISGGTSLALTSTTTNAISLDSGTTGGINIGTSSFAKTITLGNVTGATAVVINTGTGGFTVNGTSSLNGAVTSNSTIQGTSLNATTGINTGATGGTQRIDVSGNLVNIANITSSGTIITTGDFETGNEYTRSFTRTIPTTVNNEVDLGSFAYTNGGGNLQINLTVPSSAFSQSKTYEIPVGFNATANVWQIVQPISDSGPYSGNDVALEINVNSGTASLRLRRVSGTTAGTAYLVMTQSGIATDAWTPSTATTAVTAPTAYYSADLLTQSAGTATVQGNLNVTTAGALQTGGTTRLTSTGILQNTTYNGNTIGVLYGGTNATTIGAAGTVAYSNGTNYAFTAAGTSGQCLLSGGAATPTFGSCATGGVTGSGTVNTIALFNGSGTSVGNSYLTQSANGIILASTPTATATAALLQLGTTAIVGGNAATNGGTYLGLNEPSSGAGSAADFLNFQVNGATKFNVTNAGNVNIGPVTTAGLQTPLVVRQDGGATTYVSIQNNSGPAGFLFTNGSGVANGRVFAIGGAGGYEGFSADGSSTSLAVLQGGNIAIGGTTAGAQLQVTTSATGTIGEIISGVSGQTADLLDLKTNGTLEASVDASGQAMFANGATTIQSGGYINSAGNITSTYGTIYSCTQCGTYSQLTGNSLIFGTDTSLYRSASNQLGTNSSLTVNNNGLFKPTTNSTTAFQIQNSAGTNVLTADTTNNRLVVGPVISNASPVGNLYVQDNISSTASATATLASNTGPNDIVISGNYLYEVNDPGNTLKIFDAAGNGADLTLEGTSATTGLNAPQSLVVQGKYAYVANKGNNTLQIFDVSNVRNPVSIGSITTTGGTPNSVTVQGRYAFVTTLTGTEIEAFDISNPTSIVRLSNRSGSGAPSNPGLVNNNGGSKITSIQGKYAYVANNGTGTIDVFDISNPAAIPAYVGNNVFNAPLNSITVQGKYAYVADNYNCFRIVDISNPAAQSQIGFNCSGASGDNNVVIEGRYAFVTSFGDGVFIYDITNTAYPVPVGEIPSGYGSQALSVSGRYLYVGNYSNNTILAYDLGGAYAPQLEAGSLQAGSIQTRQDLTVGGNTALQGGLTVGQSAQFNSTIGVGGVLGANTATGRVSVNGSATTMATPGTITSATSTSGGSLAATTFYYKITAIDAAGGQTTASNEVSQTTTGTTSKNTLTWAAITGANAYRIYRSTSSGTETYLATFNGNPTTGFVDTGSVSSTTAFTIPTVTTAMVSVNNSNASLQVSIGGNGTPTGQLYVSGTVPTGAYGSTSTGSGSNPISVYVQGRYAYTVNNTSNTLAIYDVSNPAAPVSVGSVTTGASSTPFSVYVQGRYAYVANYGTNTLGIYDVSNPVAPVNIGSVNTGTGSGPGYVYVQGRYAYVANYGTNTLGIYDVSNPVAPVNIGSVNTGSGPESLYVQGRYAYVANSGSNTLGIYDVSNPSKPVSVGSVATANSPYSVYVQGRYAYVANYSSNNMAIYDVSNPAAPINVGSVATANGPYSVYVQGRYAYVTNAGSNTLGIYDVSNPANPVSVGSVTTGNSPESVYVQGRYAYVTNTTSNTITTYDIGGTYTQQLEAGGLEAGTGAIDTNFSVGGDTNLQGGLTVGQSAQINGSLGVGGMFGVNAATGRVSIDGTFMALATPGTITTATATTGGFLAANTYYYKITAIDAAGGQTTASPEASKTTTGTTSTVTLTWTAVPGASAYRIYRSTSTGTETYLTTFNGNPTTGFVDSGSVSTSAAFTIPAVTTATTSTSTTNASEQLTVGGNGTPTSQLYVSGTVPSGLLATVANTGNINAVYVQGRYSYVVYSGGGLQIFDVSNPAVPVSVGNASTGTSPQAVYVQGRYAYVANRGSTNLQIFDVSNPAAPVSVGTVTTGANPYSVYVQGRYAYVPSFTGNTLGVYDVSNPAAPVSVGSVATGAGPQAVTVQGRYAYVVNYTAGTLTIYDISTPTAPVLVTGGSIATGTNPYALYVQGRYAYVANSGSGTLSVVDVSNPATPVNVGSIATGTSPRSVYVQGRYAYIANYGSNNFGVYDISNPATPFSVGTVSTAGSPDSVYVQGRYLYLGSYTGNYLSTYDLGGAYTQQLEAGGIETGTLSTNGNANIVGTLSVTSGLAVNGTTQLQGNSSVSGTFAATGKTCLGVGTCPGTEELGVYGTIIASGTITASSTPDLAETIPAADNVEAADVVMADPNNTEAAVQSNKAYNSAAIGVISDGTSSFLINAHGGSVSQTLTGKPLVLTGRVPVHVTNEGGSIMPGDYLTTSSTPGYAMKATHAGPTIGKALGFFNGDSGTVLILVNISYYSPDASSDIQANNATFNSVTVNGGTSTSSLNVGGMASVQDLQVMGSADIANNLHIGGDLSVDGNASITGNVAVGGNLTVYGMTNVQDITINGHVITAGNTPTVTVLPASGSMHATATVTGNDTSGTITVTVGDPSAPASADGKTQAVTGPTIGDLIKLVFNKSYNKTPRIQITGNDAGSAKLLVFPDLSASDSFELSISNQPTANNTYTFNYWAVE